MTVSKMSEVSGRITGRLRQIPQYKKKTYSRAKIVQNKPEHHVALPSISRPDNCTATFHFELLSGHGRPEQEPVLRTFCTMLRAMLKLIPKRLAAWVAPSPFQ